MDLSINWLNNILSFNIPLHKTKQLQKLLTFHGFNPDYLTLNGFEVESIYNVVNKGTKDIIVEIDTTPNRRDLHSIAGICQELGILLNVTASQKTFYAHKNNKFYETKQLSTFLKTDISPYDISYTQIHNINVKPSPRWLKKRLETYNIESTNIFSDLTQYIQLEWGQTIKFYDLDKINDFNFVFEHNNKVNQFSLDDEKNITISNSRVISNEDDILSLCGVEINHIFKVDSNSKAILIECSNYSREEVKLNCSNTKLRTLISNFNEKGGTSCYRNLALQRVLKLMTLEYPELRIKKGPFYTKEKSNQKLINLTHKQIRQILGQSIKNQTLTKEEIELCTKRLKFPILTKDKNQLRVQIPELRELDIEEEIDLVEEIGRMYGFNYFQSRIPRLKKIGKVTSEQKLINQFKTFAINNGLYELVNYSLVATNRDSLITPNNYRLLNPISVGNSLQQNLTSNLLETIEFNLKQQNQLNRGFEVARIFHKQTNQEATFLSGFVTNEKYQNNWGTQAQDYSWYQFKSLINNLISYISLEGIHWIQTQTNMTGQFHPGRTAILKSNSNTIGIIGQIHPVYAKNKNINPETFIFELNGTLISQIQTQAPITYKNFAVFPEISRDISFTIKKMDATSRYDALLTQFTNQYPNLVKKLYLKDNYEFEKQNQSYRTLTYSFVFQSKYRTLKNSDIEKWIQKLQDEIGTITETN